MNDLRIENGTVIDASRKLMWLLPGIQIDRALRFIDAKFEIGKLCVDAHKSYNDWQLPTREELEVMMNYARTTEWADKGKPSLSQWFRNREIFINPKWYWTSTRWRESKEHFYCVNFDDGEVDVQHEEDRHYLWPVRNIE